ncbi:hypothetical protein [Paenibacillus sanfengchensis]|uniref:hypothetical protein n=1 Tax=Paenibacillus sanfengchensis TaxID=3119819 RepID=UPI002FE0B5BA
MTKRIVDYVLDEWIRSQTDWGSRDAAQPKITWQHRVQYAVGHAVNDYFTMDPAVRVHTPIQVLLNRRWPRSRADFKDPLHYWRVYNRIVAQLTRITGEMIYEYPLALYENWETQVTELDVQLSVIFQAVWKSESGGGPNQVKVQKFLVENNEELVKAFVHTAHVFWHSAYGEPPGKIEVHALLDERKYIFTREMLDLQKSLDYVRLLAETVDARSGTEKADKREGKVECQAPAEA